MMKKFENNLVNSKKSCIFALQNKRNMKTIINVESLNRHFEIDYSHTNFPSYKNAINDAKKFITESSIFGINKIICTIYSEKKGELTPKYEVYNIGCDINVDEF